jgi:hypothetical protein
MPLGITLFYESSLTIKGGQLAVGLISLMDHLRFRPYQAVHSHVDHFAVLTA